MLREIKFDADEEAVNQIEKYVECGYVVKFPTLQQAKEYVGGDLVLSDLVMLEKMRADGTVKRRVIINCDGAFGVMAYVNDVADAYWNVPVARAERRCTCSYEQHKGVEEDHSCGDV